MPLEMATNPKCVVCGVWTAFEYRAPVYPEGQKEFPKPDTSVLGFVCLRCLRILWDELPVRERMKFEGVKG